MYSAFLTYLWDAAIGSLNNMYIYLSVDRPTDADHISENAGDMHHIFVRLEICMILY